MINPEKAQRSFRIAYDQYSSAKDLIKEMSSYVQVVQKDFSHEKAMRQFDLILQAILLRTASEDGYFLEEERQFIEKITDYADLMIYVSRKHKINVSWESFGMLDEEERKKVSLRILADIDDIITNFVLPFAVVDAILPKDYCEEITKKINLIGACLAGCDGDETDSSDFENEMIVTVALVEKAIKEKWAEVIAKTNSKNNTSAKVQSANRTSSLKDIYLKKTDK